MVALFASDASRFRFPPPKPTRFRPSSISYPDLHTPRVEFIVNMMVRIASIWFKEFVFFLNIAAERPGLAPTECRKKHPSHDPVSVYAWCWDVDFERQKNRVGQKFIIRGPRFFGPWPVVPLVSVLRAEFTAIRRRPLGGFRGGRPRNITKECAGQVPLLVRVVRPTRLSIANSARNTGRFLRFITCGVSH